ncbi:unnamed protein product [Coccothraustes coccothraustes]
MAGKDEKDGKDGKDGSTDGWAGIEERLEKIRESLRTPSAPRSRRVRACDRALRSCAAELARPGGLLAHGAQLLALAQEATQLYLSLEPEPPELYLEKILFHVLRNAAAWAGPHAWSAAELLRERLRRGRGGGDWATVTSSAFGVLWNAAAALAGPERPREEGRAVLTARIRALRFLLLLESRDGESSPRESFQPPFFTSPTAQHAAAAAALYEAQRAPCPLFVAGQLREFLLDALRDEAPQPPGLRESLCFLELTLQRCRHLCKARRPRDALDALEDSRTFLGAGNSLGAPLELLEAGIQLGRALPAKGVAAVGPALRRAGAALAAECSGRVLRLLLESSQFVLAQLGEVLRRSRELPLGLQDLPGVCGFCQGHGRALRRLLAQVPPGSVREQVMVKQLLFQALQLFSSAIHEIFQRSQPSEGPELSQVTASCVQSVTWMLEGLEGLPEAERGKFLDVTAVVTFRLGQALQSRNVPEGAGAVCEPLCRAVLAGHGYGWPGVTPERLHKCFRLQVESWRCRARPERALDAVAQWLLPIPGQPGSLVAELVALWARIKTEAAKQGAEELRLRTLRDALECQSRCHRLSLPGDTLLLLLLAELQAYKSLRAPTGPERYNVLCDLLGLWDPEGAWDPPGPWASRDPPGMPDPGRSLPRAAALLELGQLLCSQSFSAHTDCSALDAIQESLRLLESLSQNSQSCNSQIRDQLLDERAQALLWLHICTLEALLEKSVARERRGQGRAPEPGWDREPEGERPPAPGGIRCSLGSESALSKPLDEALSLWKKLLEGAGVPAVRSPEQTLSSLQLLAALYRLQGKPLQALESSRLVLVLSRSLGHGPGAAHALSQLSRALLQLHCPGQAQVFLEELELCLGQEEGSEDSRLLLRHSQLLLRSHLCCLQRKAKNGDFSLGKKFPGNFGLGGGLGCLGAWRCCWKGTGMGASGRGAAAGGAAGAAGPQGHRGWLLAQAQALQLLATVLELPPALLEAPLREQIRQQGWSSPKVALLEAQRLLRSVLVSLMGSDVLGSARSRPPEEPGPDCGPALVQKWTVLGEALGCCQRLVTLLGHCEVLCRARAFCSEGLSLAGHLQAARWCSWFLVLQSQLELQQGELELSQSHLQHAQFLLQPQTEPKPCPEPRQRRAKIQLRKGHLERRNPPDPVPDPVPGGEEDEEFLQGPSLALLAPAALPEQPDALTASPELKGRKAWKSLEFLSHPSGCRCSFCRDPALVALGLRWLLAQARTWLLAGEVAPGLALVRRVLPRCASAGARLARELRDRVQGPGSGDTSRDRDMVKDKGIPGSGDISRDRGAARDGDMVKDKGIPGIWDEELERGLSLLGSQSPPVAGLGVAVATLLLAKAVATLSRVAATLGRSVDDVLAQAWTPRPPPTPNPPKPQKTPRAPPKPAAQKAKAPKARAGKTPKAKPPKPGDVFALGDSDPEVPPIVLRPGGPCTPHPKSGVTFSDSDSEEPQIPPEPPKSTQKSSCAKRGVQPQKSPGNSPGIGARPRRGRPRKELGTPKKREKRGISQVENVEKKENDIPQRALEKRERRGNSRVENVEKTGNPKVEKVEKMGNPKVEKTGNPKVENVEKMGNLNMENVEKMGNLNMENVEKMGNPKMENVGKRGNPKMEKVEKKEKGKPPKTQERKENRAPRRAGGPREKKERGGTPQSGIWEEFSGIEERDPLRAVEEEEEEEEEMSFELPPLPPGVPSLAAVRSLLAKALAWLGHFPPGSLYRQLCQLLAMALGDRDPLATAGLLAESLAVTLRHQLLAIVHARARKKRKAAAAGGDISDQLRGLSLDSQHSQHSQDSQDSQSHLAELEELFQFSSAGLGPAERERFREQLQKIPNGVTVCQLSLVSATPGALGDTLLLTRLERGQEPVSVRIATQRCQAPLSGILQEFQRIQQEQREANACTERREWWERRSRLDLRMQSLIQSLDSEVLGCWRGLLLPRDPGNSPLDEQELSQLLQELRECGWERPEPALLRVLLAGLSPADVGPLAAALCPARPLRARLLLDEALERRREGPGGSAGSLVLLLDRHLQRLPWESSGTLRNVPVTRLPGLRCLLRYGLARQRPGSVLSRGVNPQSAFYVLNPQRDLGGTEERFRAWFQSEPGWRGVSGAAPSPQQLQEALGERDLYIYAGHGAGARLLDGQSLARLPCRAVALLFGCSSAALAPRGPLEPSGTVLKFILAGCPLVLGNLWDVTDRDLDRLAQALLRGWLGGGPGTPLLAQLAQARQAPRLKSLTGAAPVAYGLPVSLC